MPAPRELRQRIRSVTSTKQITKAMELVSASRMRRATEATLANRPYATQLEVMVQRIISSSSDQPLSHPLLEEQKGDKTLLIVIASDRGQAGAYNSNLGKLASQFASDEKAAGRTVTSITLGKKAEQAMSKAGIDVLQRFPLPSGQIELSDMHALNRYVVERFLHHGISKVSVLYTEFHSMLIQKAVIQPLLPLTPPNPYPASGELIFEPDPLTVLSELLPYLVEIRLFHSVLEAGASEHSARRMAMKSATDNANSIIDRLTLTYNRLRQSAITQEIAEITSGAAALE
ncbi:MAG: ATP synthase F1 subunit gamma [bacterium]